MNTIETISIPTGPMFPKPGTIKGTIIGTSDIQADIEMLRGNDIIVPDSQEMPHGKITFFQTPMVTNGLLGRHQNGN